MTIRKFILGVVVTAFCATTLFAQATKSAALQDAFGGIKWGSPYSEVLKKIAGKLIYKDEKRSIVSRDEDLTYRYGFLYKDPETAVDAAKKQPASPAGTAPAAAAQNEPRFMYATMEFPYLTMQDVKKKIEEKYGAPTGENIKNNQGAYVWESEKTTLIMWVEQYKKAPYCRKISYISKDISIESNKYNQDMFNRTEIEVLKKLYP